MSFEPKLPDHPVDLFEFRWYTVDLSISGLPIIEHRAVYHVDTSWSFLYGDNIRGVDFVNHWQIFTNDSFSGRTTDGFHAPWKQFNFSESVFETRAEARSVAIDKCEDAIAAAQRRIAELTEKKSALHREHNDELRAAKEKD